MRVILENLEHSFKPEAVLFSNLSFELLPGNTYALVGPSGAGKSTLLNIIAGWLTPKNGEIVYESVKTIRWIFQNPHGVARRTALDHIVLPLLSQGFTRENAENKAQEYLETFNLKNIADRKFRDLSGGEAQRLMLARGIASAPDLLLVDEPTAQLDIATSATVSSVLQGVASKNHIVIVATHDEAVKNACTDVIDLSNYTKSEVQD